MQRGKGFGKAVGTTDGSDGGRAQRRLRSLSLPSNLTLPWRYDRLDEGSGCVAKEQSAKEQRTTQPPWVFPWGGPSSLPSFVLGASLRSFLVLPQCVPLSHLRTYSLKDHRDTKTRPKDHSMEGCKSLVSQKYSSPFHYLHLMFIGGSKDEEWSAREWRDKAVRSGPSSFAYLCPTNVSRSFTGGSLRSFVGQRVKEGKEKGTKGKGMENTNHKTLHQRQIPKNKDILVLTLITYIFYY